MGGTYQATCNACKHEFSVDEGGGFVFHLLRCDKCGKTKEIDFASLGEAHLRYIKGLPGPYCVVTRDSDKDIQDNYPGEPLSEEEYHAIVENVAGNCKCRGAFKFDAPPRCPKCKSDEIRETGPSICYD